MEREVAMLSVLADGGGRAPTTPTAKSAVFFTIPALRYTLLDISREKYSGQRETAGTHILFLLEKENLGMSLLLCSSGMMFRLRI